VSNDSEISVNNVRVKGVNKKNGVISFDKDRLSLRVGSGVYVIDCKF
jgi:hypothetical protein